MENKVCNISKPTKKEGSCSLISRCCRNCSDRRECDYPCLLSYGKKCKYYKGVQWRE